MKVPCDVIFDLIPLYQEDLCSLTTKKFVEDHLKECSECRQLLENNNQTIFKVKQEQLTPFDEKSAAVLKDLKCKMNKKNIRIAVLSGVTSILLLLVVVRIYVGQRVSMEEWQISALTQDQPIGVDPAEWPEPTHEEFWTVLQDDGNTLLGFNHFFTGANVLRRTRTIDGIEKDVIYINITQSDWDLFWNNLWVDSGARGEFVIDGESFNWNEYSDSGKMNLRTFDRQSSNNEIVAIYYLVGDFNELNRMDNIQFDEVEKNTFLLWER